MTHVQEDIGAFVLGALDDDSEKRVREHLLARPGRQEPHHEDHPPGQPDSLGHEQVDGVAAATRGDQLLQACQVAVRTGARVSSTTNGAP